MDHQTAIDTLAPERYLLGEMNGAERDAFEAHFFACPECADEVRTGGVMKDGVRAGLLAPAAPRRSPAGRTWRPAIAIPWAAAATLAIVAGYESVHTGSRSTPTPLALAPVTLRPATRGGEAVVVAGPGGAVTLAVLLPDEVDKPVQYELVRGDSRIASGEAPAALAGAPLLLMIPGGVLNAGDHCLLRVKNAGSADLTPEEYRFRVESR